MSCPILLASSSPRATTYADFIDASETFPCLVACPTDEHPPENKTVMTEMKAKPRICLSFLQKVRAYGTTRQQPEKICYEQAYEHRRVCQEETEAATACRLPNASFLLRLNL